MFSLSPLFLLALILFQKGASRAKPAPLWSSVYSVVSSLSSLHNCHIDRIWVCES